MSIINVPGRGLCVEIFTPYITRGGKKVFHPEGKKFRLEIPIDKYRF